MRLPKELNSQVPGNQAEPYADTTLESPLNGAEGARISLMFLSLRPMDRAIAVVPLPFRQGSTYIVFLPPELSLFRWAFSFSFHIRGRGRILCWSF